jgi:hypothetical protein
MQTRLQVSYMSRSHHSRKAIGSPTHHRIPEWTNSLAKKGTCQMPPIGMPRSLGEWGTRPLVVGLSVILAKSAIAIPTSP